MVGTSFQTANFRREGQDNWMKVTISFASFSGILDAVASDIVNGLHFCQCAGYSIPTVTRPCLATSHTGAVSSSKLLLCTLNILQTLNSFLHFS